MTPKKTFRISARIATLFGTLPLGVLPWGVLAVACGQGAEADDTSHDETTATEADNDLAPERFPGGETTNTLLLGPNAFDRYVNNIQQKNESSFFAGNGFFKNAWVEAPASTAGRDGLGPMFNARSCSGCHFKDGPGSPPLEEGDSFVGLLLRLSVDGTDAHGGPKPDPNYGGQLQPFSNPGVPSEGSPRVTYEERAGQYADGTAYSLLVPSYRIDDLAYGPLADDIKISPRVAPATFGLGLLEAIPDERLRELADPDDADDDGISGRLNNVWDVTKAEHVVGRFGWKAEQPSVRQQSAGAFLGDMGMTTPLFTGQDCTEAQGECLAATSGGEPEVDELKLDQVERYGQLLAVPVREVWDGADIERGQKLFGTAGCKSCHVPDHRTGEHELDELEDQHIWPYTDLLLHDMGEELADNRPVFDADGREWRTPPLWGIGRYEDVVEHNRLLHDGRARGIAEAILWHGGEGSDSRDAFVKMSKKDRQLLVQFVESL